MSSMDMVDYSTVYSRIRLRDCSLALSQEPYVSLSRHTAQIDLYLNLFAVDSLLL